MEFELDSGNTAFMLTAASLVLLMTPGLAFFYGGMVRGKSVLNMMMMSFGAIGVAGLIWVLYGYSGAFGADLGGGWLGNPFEFFGLQGATDDQSLMAASGGRFELRDVPRFPPVRRDLAFVVPEAVPAGAVQAALEGAGGDLVGSSLLFDVHRGEPLAPGTKSLAFAVEFRAADRTLTGEEADLAVAEVADRLRAEFGAALRSG